MQRILLIATLLACTQLAFAAGPVEGEKEPLVFDSIEQEERFNELTLELRCLVCQNQNLADSDAPLAQDLRKEIYDMLQAGESNNGIKTFMIERYGDFVLYRPPFQGNTLALWVMPIIILLGGAVGVFFAVRRRNRHLIEQDQEGSN
ncbi:MAG: cytochrome c-type biogenesis protein [Xanthomonadales bacterium]|nr:cytochrome c-type biogenesis protein [Xanthomonadales bacterium]